MSFSNYGGLLVRCEKNAFGNFQISYKQAQYCQLYSLTKNNIHMYVSIDVYNYNKK